MRSEDGLEAQVADDRILYLSSLDSVIFEPARQCRLGDILVFESGKLAARASLDPGVPGGDFGLPGTVEQVILTTRFEGTSIQTVDEFPCFVFVCVPADPNAVVASPLHAHGLRIIAWGELYRTAEDARDHRIA